MTDQKKLLLAAEAALDGYSINVMAHYGMFYEWEKQHRLGKGHLDAFSREERCLYLCLLAAAWDDL